MNAVATGTDRGEAGREGLGRTPSQTVGPFFGFALPWPDGPKIVEEGAPGAIRLTGRVTDGAGEPVPDCLIETWQADAAGHYPEPGDPAGGGAFRGFGRCPTDGGGEFTIVTVKPGPVADGADVQAPHLAVTVLARGLLHHLVTRLYFADETEANRSDPVLALVPESRRETLLARPTADGYRFDIRLQGDGETVFFDF